MGQHSNEDPDEPVSRRPVPNHGDRPDMRVLGWVRGRMGQSRLL